MHNHGGFFCNWENISVLRILQFVKFMYTYTDMKPGIHQVCHTLNPHGVLQLCVPLYFLLDNIYSNSSNDIPDSFTDVDKSLAA